MKKYNRFLLALLTLTSIVGATAQEVVSTSISTVVSNSELADVGASTTQVAPSVAPWTLQQCIDYALANNIQLRQGLLTIQQDDVTIMANRGQLLPSLSFIMSQNFSWLPWSEQFVDVQNGSMSATNSVANLNGNYGLSSQWTVWDGGRNRKNLELSKINRTQSIRQAEVTAATIQEQIAQLYVQILYQNEGVEMYRKIAESSQTQADRAKQMYEVGSMSKADLAQIESQLSQDNYNVVNSITQLEECKLQLKQLLEIVNTEEFNVATPSVDEDKVLSLIPSKADVYSLAVQTRPEIQYAKGNIDVADMNINIAKRGYYPTISMNAGINTSGGSGMRSNYFNQLKNNFNTMLGLSLDVPIFDNYKSKANLLSSQLCKESAQLDMEAADRDLFSSVETLWLNARNAQQQYIASKSNVDAMEKSFTLVSEQFNVGLKDVVSLITGKNNLLQAQQQLLQSKYTALLNIALLRFYSGDSLSL